MLHEGQTLELSASKDKEGFYMDERLCRTASLIGEEKVNKLLNSKVAVFGLGGVGGYTVEILARSGVGELHLIDDDTISISNVNRQIIALSKDFGKAKVNAFKERINDINPKIKVVAIKKFYLPENADEFDFCEYDYIVDAIDTVRAKLSIIERAKSVGVPVISCMGTGNKLDPTAFKVGDIYSTKVCPLAKVMRRELKKGGIDSLKVVYSDEIPLSVVVDSQNGRHSPGSMPFTPAVAGIILASEVIKDLIK